MAKAAIQSTNLLNSNKGISVSLKDTLMWFLEDPIINPWLLDGDSVSRTVPLPQFAYI